MGASVISFGGGGERGGGTPWLWKHFEGGHTLMYFYEKNLYVL